MARFAVSRDDALILFNATYVFTMMSLPLPTVSIIISAYEGLSYLPGTINSILQQTFENFEILVFSDNYRQIYPWFERQPDCRFRFIVQDNLGLSKTINQGILEARGKYIAFVQPGDLWHPHKLYKQVSCLDHDRHLGLIYSWSMLIDHQGKSTGGVMKQAYVENLANSRSPDPFLEQILRTTPMDELFQRPEILAQNQISFSSVMLRRDCFEVVGLFDPDLKLIPDWEMWIRLSHYYQFMAIAEPLVYSRQHRSSDRDCWSTLETDLQATIEKVYARLSPELETQKHLSYGYASLFLAKNVLLDKNPNLVIAHNYWYQALQHDPLLVFSWEFCQLRWEVFSLNCQQNDFYSSLRQLIKALRSQCKTILEQTKKSAHKAFTWMLEEEDNINVWKSPKVKQQTKE